MRLSGLRVILYSLLLTGCAASSIVSPPYYELSSTQLPIKGTSVTSELGDTLVSSICQRQAPSWRISAYGTQDDDSSPSVGELLGGLVSQLYLPAQVLKPLGTTSSGLRVFAATEGSVGFPPNRKPLQQGGLYNAFCEKNGTLHHLCNSLSSSDFLTDALKADSAAFVERASYVDLDYPSLQQELIFNGRIENNLRFVYRELATQKSGGAVMRSPFQQEVQYDLGESDVIGFKGARLQIIKATNRNVTYKVIQHFPIDCTSF